MEINYDAIKYDLAIDKLEELNKEILTQEIHINHYEKQPEIRKFIAVTDHPTVIKYIDLLDLHKETSHKIGELKKENKNNPNIDLLIDKARTIKKEINRLKQEEIVLLYLDLLNNYKVQYYLANLKEIERLNKQVSIQEQRVNDLDIVMRNKILIKKD